VRYSAGFCRARAAVVARRRRGAGAWNRRTRRGVPPLRAAGV